MFLIILFTAICLLFPEYFMSVSNFSILFALISPIVISIKYLSSEPTNVVLFSFISHMLEIPFLFIFYYDFSILIFYFQVILLIEYLLF